MQTAALNGEIQTQLGLPWWAAQVGWPVAPQILVCDLKGVQALAGTSRGSQQDQ